MLKTDPNDFAFPSSEEEICSGLTKREEFAKAALQGLLSDFDYTRYYEANINSIHAILAEEAVEFADALIDRLNEK